MVEFPRGYVCAYDELRNQHFSKHVSALDDQASDTFSLNQGCEIDLLVLRLINHSNDRAIIF